MQTVKMVVTGAVNAGKTEFIRSISDIEVVSTERRATDDTRMIKHETTVAMDFGRIAIADDLVLHLFGTPGQKRFDFMWEILSEGMLGLIILVDSTRPETFRETNRIIDFFVSFRETPFVIAANKQDRPNAWAPDELRLALRQPAHVKILPCVASDRASVKNILLELLYVIQENSEEA
ncbi:GTP-binding protein [Candidatus Chloroploca asiatica]|uniref:GTP-binding protein n=1 Tax=Candidatus Chloroploca asiatica TaxID=1506545 RepID=A0A2H3KNZ1_9CHLR|nr:ATP/GTP-binding protein [Candidatus Chloroploca asiatica]PDV99124.1 GTP-binding protein [Candidatus Chloroploca asiatica]